MLDEGHVPCILHKAPVTQEGKLVVRKTVLLPGPGQKTATPATEYLKAPL